MDYYQEFSRVINEYIYHFGFRVHSYCNKTNISHMLVREFRVPRCKKLLMNNIPNMVLTYCKVLLILVQIDHFFVDESSFELKGSINMDI